MIERHLRNHGSLEAIIATGARARTSGIELVLESRLPDLSTPSPAKAAGSSPNKARRVDWEKVMLWFFIIFSFAALFFCSYILSARLHVQ